MLDHYSIAQKLAYGAGAFAFVFSAAMGGTLFMITGGFSDGGRSPPADPPALTSNALPADAQAPVLYAQAQPSGDVGQAMQVEPTPAPLAPPAAVLAPPLQTGSIEITGSTPPPMTLRGETQEETEPPKSPDDAATDQDDSPADSGDKSSE